MYKCNVIIYMICCLLPFGRRSRRRWRHLERTDSCWSLSLRPYDHLLLPTNESIKWKSMKIEKLSKIENIHGRAVRYCEKVEVCIEELQKINGNLLSCPPAPIPLNPLNLIYPPSSPAHTPRSTRKKHAAPKKRRVRP